jgi:CYTH domain-containing protein
MLEIERKFLVKRLPADLKRFPSALILQGYLATELRGAQVRLRKRGQVCSLAFKRARGYGREEREIRLTRTQFNALWPGTSGRRLRKTRYEIPWNGRIIEVDVYRGQHRGLVVAEVEFRNRNACDRFKPPEWLGREVTGSKRYSNVRLAGE